MKTINTQYIIASTVIKQNIKQIRVNKEIITQLGKAFAKVACNKKFTDPGWGHAWKLWYDLCHQTKYALPRQTRALHLVKGFIKGKRFDQIEQWYYVPPNFKLMFRHNDIYSLQLDRRIKQLAAIRAAKEYLRDDQHKDFDLWIKTTSTRKIVNE